MWKKPTRERLLSLQAMLMLMQSLKDKLVRPGRAHFGSDSTRLCVTFIAFALPLFSLQWRRARPCTEHKNNGPTLIPMARWFNGWLPVLWKQTSIIRGLAAYQMTEFTVLGCRYTGTSTRSHDLFISSQLAQFDQCRITTKRGGSLTQTS